MLLVCCCMVYFAICLSFFKQEDEKNILVLKNIAKIDQTQNVDHTT